MTAQRSPRKAFGRSSTGASGTEKASISPESQRFTYVLDTSVLLSDPWSVTRFAEHAVVLPLVVISELEAKRHHPELERRQRQPGRAAGLTLGA